MCVNFALKRYSNIKAFTCKDNRLKNILQGINIHLWTETMGGLINYFKKVILK